MPSKNKRLRVMAGPNGSGKSTILRELQQKFYSGPFVNADEIQKALLEARAIDLSNFYHLVVDDASFAEFVLGPGSSWEEKANNESSPINVTVANNTLSVRKAPSAYDAAIAADFIRHQLLLKGETFTFETVLSHSSKVQFLKESVEAGFKNYLYFICTIDPAINIERVSQRVQLGGHSVPEDRIVKRYTGSLEVLAESIPLCHRVYLFDNSTEERSIEPVAEIDDSHRFIAKVEQMPWWVHQYVIKRLYQ